MKQQLLLIEDIENLGRSGDIVTAKPGFIRNFLLPQKKAIIAGKHTIIMQKRLQEERKKQAEADKKEALAWAKNIEKKEFTIEVKVDAQGNLYGSVAIQEIAKLLEGENIPLGKKAIQLTRPIKKVGVFDIGLRLKEGITTSFKLHVKGDKESPSLEEKVETEEESEKGPEDVESAE